MSLKSGFLLASLLALGATDAFAQCQGPGTVCAEYDTATYVFFARVSQVSPDPDDRTLGALVPQNVTFDVIEDFKGTAGGATILTFDQSSAGARLFSVGEIVLVYARSTRENSIWFAGCSRTRRTTAEDPELETLRQIRGRTRGGSLEGNLMIPANRRPPALAPEANLANVTISLQALDGSETLAALSQPSGYFLFPWLKPGVYRLRVESPELASVIQDVTIGETARCQTLNPISVRPR
jgi:hypothetical protein